MVSSTIYPKLSVFSESKGNTDMDGSLDQVLKIIPRVIRRDFFSYCEYFLVFTVIAILRQLTSRRNGLLYDGVVLWCLADCVNRCYG